MISHAPSPVAPPEVAPMFLRPVPVWSRAILWTILTTATAFLLWTIFARMDEVVAATGQLEPQDSTQEIQSPVAGVIEALLVRDGDRVSKGQTLLRLDPKVTRSQIASQEEALAALRKENDFYRSVLAPSALPPAAPGSAPVAPELANLAQDRLALLSENRLLQAQIRFSPEGQQLTPEQLIQFTNAEKDRLERLQQTTLNAGKAETDLTSSIDLLKQNEKLLENSRQVLASYSNLVDKGGVSRVEFLTRQAEAIRAEAQVERIGNLIAQAKLELARAREEERNINTAYQKNALDRQAANIQRLAEIDARLGKARADNEQRIAQLDSQLAALRASLDYHEIRAPAAGVVFDLAFKQNGAVIPVSAVVLKIVPDDRLLAKVHIPNRDIGFVHEKLPAEIRIDSFPYREFGSISGRVAMIGGDALPPSQAVPYYSFPAKILLDQESLPVGGKTVRLQAGMSVQVLIKIRTRRVISIFTDFLLGPFSRMEEVR